MTKLLRGQFRAKLDSKGRLLLPTPLRQNLSSSKQDKAIELVFTNNIFKRNKFLEAYTLKGWLALEKKVASWPTLKPEVQSYKRFYIAAGQAVASDSQGRFLLPLGLRGFCQLEESKEVVLVGMGDKFEIWPAEIWDKLNLSMLENFESVVSAVSVLDEEA